MREIFFFAIGATVAGTMFLVALVELFFTVRRRKVHEELTHKLQEIKVSYNQTLNSVVTEQETKLEESDKAVEAAHAEVEAQKAELTKEFEDQVDQVKAKSGHAVEIAKARAKKMEKEAEMKAEAYLETRKTEVEQELMNLVMNVTKKVLPASLPYEIQKELVINALRDAKTGNDNDSR